MITPVQAMKCYFKKYTVASFGCNHAIPKVIYDVKMISCLDNDNG